RGVGLRLRPRHAGAPRGPRRADGRGAVGAVRGRTRGQPQPRVRPRVSRFAARRALVTGASRGIGAALAERLAAEGAGVAIVARTLDRHPTLPGSLRETATRIEGRGGRVAVIAADLAGDTDRARIVPEAEAALDGPLDVLVNNAAAAMD